MAKHAYLIMAHNNWNILKRLLMLLDDERNDIYLHIDKKVADYPKRVIDELLSSSSIYYIDAKKVYWADYSQVDVTLELLKKAYENGRYSYYHLLSGNDLPIKSNDEIHSFFDKYQGKEFIGIVPKEVYYSVRRVKFYHLFTHCSLYRNCKVLKILDRLLEYAQQLIGINRIRNYREKIIDGWTWFSITSDFCNYILERRNMIEKMFSMTIASDELFMQTMIYNSGFRNNLYDETDLKNGSMRFIDWKRGTPYTWGGAIRRLSDADGKSVYVCP